MSSTPNQQTSSDLEAIGCATVPPIALTVLIVGIVANIIALPLKFALGIGETVKHALSAFTGGSGTTTATDCSGVAKVPKEWLSYVQEAAEVYLGGDEAALIALIQIESGWNPNARNPGSSAAGLGQFLTSTALGMKEFVGGDDKHNTSQTPWPPGKVTPAREPDDARFDPKRAIYAAAHLLGPNMTRYGGLRAAYENAYHGGLRLGGAPAEEARRGGARLEGVYNKLKENGGCKEARSFDRSIVKSDHIVGRRYYVTT